MAKLVTGNLALEFRYKELDNAGWIQYEILFLYKDKPIINDSVLRRGGGDRSGRTPGAFRANECGEEGLIHALRRALESDEPQFCEPIEPDFVAAVYPHWVFPFISGYHDFIPVSEDAIRAVDERRRASELASGRLPDDVFTFIFMVDMQNFGDELGYWGFGPALIMKLYRYEVQKFLDDLEIEYAEFCRTWNYPGEAADY